MSQNRNPVNKNHLEICLSSSHKSRNSLAWILTTLSVCPTSVLAHIESPPNLELVSGNCKSYKVIDNEKSWRLRADARRMLALYHQTQVSLQGAGFEPVRASRAWIQFPCRKLELDCSCAWVAKGKKGTLLLASKMPYFAPTDCNRDVHKLHDFSLSMSHNSRSPARGSAKSLCQAEVGRPDKGRQNPSKRVPISMEGTQPNSIPVTV